MRSKGMQGEAVGGDQEKKGCGHERDDGSEVLFLSCPAGETGGGKPTMRHGVAMPISSRTLPLYPTAGPRVHASTGSRAEAGEREKGRRLTPGRNLIRGFHGRTPQDRDSAPSPATPSEPQAQWWTTYHGRPRGRGEESIGQASECVATGQQNNTSKKKKRCTHWLTAASRL